MDEDSFLNKDMKRTILKIRILGRICVSKVNSYALLKELGANSDFTRFFGAGGGIKNEVYNTLKSLERSGCVKVSERRENNRPKHYYTITKKGRAVVGSAKSVLERHLKEIDRILGG